MMTKLAIEVMLHWASRQELKTQREFSKFLESKLEHYSKPGSGGITVRVMEKLIDLFEGNPS